MFIAILSLCLLFTASAVNGQRTARDRYEKEISFSGYDWLVKSSFGRTGPGPNFFSHSPEKVSVDNRDRLHLSVSQKEGRWFSTEVVSKKSFGYGRYKFLLGSNPADLDENIVLGLFTWDNDLKPHHNEIDIEFSRWGESSNDNAQYVIHTGRDQAVKHRFNIPGWPRKTLHIITWTPGKLFFESYRGRRAWSWRKIASFKLSGDRVPVPANEQVRMNLWLTGGIPPEGNENPETRIIIDSFSFTAM